MRIEKYTDIDGTGLKIRIFPSGNKVYTDSNNQLHRLDGPAIECESGHSEWYKNNKLHRIGAHPCMMYFLK